MPSAAQLLPETAYVAGLIALRDARYGEAISLLDQAVREMPAHPGRRLYLVRALLAAEQYREAADVARGALELTPEDPDLLFALGSALSTVDASGPALRAFLQALRIRPTHAPSWLGLANLLIDLDDLAAGEAFCRRALEIDPILAEGHASLGFVLTRVGRLREAIDACDKAICHRADFAQAHWNRAIALLLSGDLGSGFAAFEWRKRHPRFKRDFPKMTGPEWRGTDPAGQRILIRAEQGAGDTIQFARYALLIRDIGGTPILACHPKLLPLLSRLAGVVAVDRGAFSAADYDAWIDQASLPFAFTTTLNTIPFSGGYLTADPERVRLWRQTLPDGPRVGLVFAGNPKHSGDKRRSIPATVFASLLAIQGITFINLQHGSVANMIDLPSLADRMHDFGETAAIIEALDLVITVDTSVAHLAGALGKPTWVLLPHAPDWRWMLDRSDSPWYYSMRLYRQPFAGDWASVLTQVSCDLREQSW